MIEARQRIAPNDEAPPVGVLDLLAALAAAIEEIRDEMARHGMVPTPRPDPERALDFEPAGARLEALSKRQRQVLSGIVRGCASKIIAWELGLSVRTVEAYRAQLYERLGARNATDAVRLALAAGLRVEEGRA